VASICIEGVAASTRAMDAYGGVQLPCELVESVANNLKRGSMQWGLHHDPRVALDVTVLDAFTRTGSDGHVEAVVRFEVDENQWQRTGTSAPEGLSISGSQRFLGDPDVSPAVTIAADAHWFSDDQIRAAFEKLAAVGEPVEGCRLYQFAAEPPALVALAFVLQQLSTIPTGLLCSYIYDALKNFVGPHVEPSKFSLTFDKETGGVTHAYLETTSDDVLKHAIDTLPGIVDNGGQYENSESEKVWKAEG